ncbi:MAG TPA: S-adenosylmethionine:tRNA ribosyltransferase-isomerase, partial [Candidatus Binataceae bacterium]|nr:S-adenosylmethionine:tRNA ribosyltransferase-isomerase [Candidatus Binataceae bacterium]
MKIDDLDYHLPEELIAQEPLERRDEARLLVLHRKSGEVEHSRFYKLARHLNEGDLLILNDTRVMPARLFANKETGGRIEVLFVRPMTERPGSWQAMVRAHRPLKEGTRLLLDDGHAIVLQGYARPGRAIVASENSVPLDELIRSNGVLALPHYINREVKANDADDYQTIYASQEGAIAAPTAGLHFTDEVFRSLADAGVRRAFVTLHIGPGTFAPLRSDVVEQ